MLSIFKKEPPAIVEPASNIKELAHDGDNYFSDELIVLDDSLTGNLFCAKETQITTNGILTGNITSKTCSVSGQINGDILSLDLLHIKATAVISGNIRSAKVHIEPGAIINGYIATGQDIEVLKERWGKLNLSPISILLNTP